MNWSELNRKLDERLEPEDALVIARRFGLNPDQFSATPTLRELVLAGDMSLGDVARILDPNAELEEEPEGESEVVYGFGEEEYPPEYLEAEARLDAELAGRERTFEIAGEPAHYFPQAPQVVDEFDRRQGMAEGVTDDEAEWLTRKFGLASRPVQGTPLGQIVEDYDLDPDHVADSLALMSRESAMEAAESDRPKRTLDLDNPEDVSAMYNAMRAEHVWRQLKAAAIFLVIIGVLWLIISMANSGGGSSPTVPPSFPTGAPPTSQ